MIPSMKATSFMKGLAKAQADVESGKKVKTQLKRRLTQVKKLAAQPGAKKGLRQELERLENSVMQVAAMEKQILNKEDMDIRDLKFQINDLKAKLSLTGAEGLKQSLDRITFLLGELSSRMETYTNIQTEREKRMEALEKKIKEKMDVHFKELVQMEKSLEGLEQRYEEIKKTEKASATTLKKIEEKISELREKLIEKRGEIVRKKMMQKTIKAPDFDEMDSKLDDYEEHLPMKFKEHLPAKPIPPPKLVFPKEAPVKHKMMFPRMPEPPRPKKEPDFIPPPRPKKKGFFGWLKKIFKK
jgi:chromosome segregation ATPase